MRHLLTVLTLTAALAACATGEGPAPTALSPAAERGQQFVLRACAGCHAVAGREASPNAVAPAFASIRMRHTEVGLERSLAQIAREGHGEMPPIYMTGAEMDDIVAYIESLAPVAEASKPGRHRVQLTAQDAPAPP
ncbi:MAG: cytochrome c [Phenylobacterium sp.]|uniref:c-type cytochrome n=1 Tax=Phenylobacterium sp. TaxID=1871053 RepID=UPI0027253285|nr:cytochrome c [Phenylobacterium sp.]MDO8411852.1 cytochrome c [Phenylobacterium sp.]